MSIGVKREYINILVPRRTMNFFDDLASIFGFESMRPKSEKVEIGLLK